MLRPVAEPEPVIRFEARLCFYEEKSLLAVRCFDLHDGVRSLADLSSFPEFKRFRVARQLGRKRLPHPLNQDCFRFWRVARARCEPALL